MPKKETYRRFEIHSRSLSRSGIILSTFSSSFTTLSCSPVPVSCPWGSAWLRVTEAYCLTIGVWRLWAYSRRAWAYEISFSTFSLQISLSFCQIGQSRDLQSCPTVPQLIHFAGYTFPHAFVRRMSGRCNPDLCMLVRCVQISHICGKSEGSGYISWPDRRCSQIPEWLDRQVYRRWVAEWECSVPDIYFGMPELPPPPIMGWAPLPMMVRKGVKKSEEKTDFSRAGWGKLAGGVKWPPPPVRHLTKVNEMAVVSGHLSSLEVTRSKISKSCPL